MGLFIYYVPIQEEGLLLLLEMMERMVPPSSRGILVKIDRVSVGVMSVQETELLGKIRSTSVPDVAFSAVENATNRFN